MCGVCWVQWARFHLLTKHQAFYWYQWGNLALSYLVRLFYHHPWDAGEQILPSMRGLSDFNGSQTHICGTNQCVNQFVWLKDAGLGHDMSCSDHQFTISWLAVTEYRCFPLMLIFPISASSVPPLFIFLRFFFFLPFFSHPSGDVSLWVPASSMSFICRIQSSHRMLKSVGAWGGRETNSIFLWKAWE